MPEFKDMLKYFRMRENLSQSELAEKLGVSASTISMYEFGKKDIKRLVAYYTRKCNSRNPFDITKYLNIQIQIGPLGSRCGIS